MAAASEFAELGRALKSVFAGVGDAVGGWEGAPVGVLVGGNVGMVGKFVCCSVGALVGAVVFGHFVSATHVFLSNTVPFKHIQPGLHQRAHDWGLGVAHVGMQFA
jgi:hypothetical protein